MISWTYFLNLVISFIAGIASGYYVNYWFKDKAIEKAKNKTMRRIYGVTKLRESYMDSIASDIAGDSIKSIQAQENISRDKIIEREIVTENLNKEILSEVKLRIKESKMTVIDLKNKVYNISYLEEADWPTFDVIRLKEDLEILENKLPKLDYEFDQNKKEHAVKYIKRFVLGKKLLK